LPGTVTKMRKITGMTVLIVAAVACASGCGTGEAKLAPGEALQAAAPLPVQVSRPQVSDIFATYQTTTTVESDAEAPVVARVAGEVVEILVEEGDIVEAGQTLARLDGDRLRLQMLKTKAELDQTTGEYARFLSLRERGLVSASAFDGLQFDMNALQASYELKRLNYNYTKIRAPIAGVISSRDIKAGQHLDENDPAFRISDTSRLVAYLKIPQAELSKFAAGHGAQIRVDAMPDDAFEAEIARISPTINAASGTFRATVYIDNSDGLLAPGMFGRFSIAYEKHADALVIPKGALVDEDGESVVYVVRDGVVERRKVAVGIETKDRIEVLDGLGSQEDIVVTGHSGLRDGSRVLASGRSVATNTG